MLKLSAASWRSDSSAKAETRHRLGPALSAQVLSPQVYSGAMEPRPVARFTTASGRNLYQIPLEVFPGFVGNVYVLTGGDGVILVDCGSGMEQARRELVAGFAAIGERFGEPVTLQDVSAILITHGHIDHFGGLPWAKAETGAPAGVHILDRRVLSSYEERVVVASKGVASFLERAGVSPEARAGMMEMYLFAKGRYHSTPVDFLLEEGQPTPGDLEVFHVPGHCPGQVCLRVDDVLLTADHVLARITPNQAPEAITQYTGLGHYLESLDKIARVPGIRLGLGGHEGPIDDLYGRVGEIRQVHERRLEQVLEICREPRSTVEISRKLFGVRQSYHILLALIETGAHLEYLYQRGELYATNVEEIEAQDNPVIRYRRF
jgi:glyoxylase-like metal-dependent hydrolase (beta-lactamase superfamily II)